MNSMGRRRNVLFIFHCSDLNNGGVRSMIDVLDRLIEEGHINVFAAFPEINGTAQEYLRVHGAEIVPFRLATWHHQRTGNVIKDFTDVVGILLRQYRNLGFMLRIGRYIQENKIDCVYTNTFGTYVGALCKKRFGIPHIWHIREFGEEDHNMKPLFGWGEFYRLVNQYTDHIFVISQSLYERYKVVINCEMMSVVYDDVSPEYIVEKHDRTETLNILIAGTLQPGKKQLDAIKIVELSNKTNSNLHLFIAGMGDEKYEKTLKGYITDHNLQDVITFLGYVRDMNDLRKKMDVGIVCSQSEAFGRVTVEGMLAHMLMIGANTAGTRELIQNGETGYLYEPGNIEEAAEIISCINKDRSLLDTIAERSYEYAKRTFANGKCAKAISKTIIDLTGLS